MANKKYDAFCSRYIDRFQLKPDKDYSNREVKLHILEAFLDGSIYDNLTAYYLEYSGGETSGKYIPLAKRRPSVIYPIHKIIVDESVSMLFGEGHFPIVRCEHEETTNCLDYLTRVSGLKTAVIELARAGSIGSSAFLIRVLDKKFYYEILNAKHLFPYFSPLNPTILKRLTESKKYDGATLQSMGYTIPKDEENYIFCLDREWDTENETYFLPYRTDTLTREESVKRTKDENRSFTHGLGFVPILWIQNLPKTCCIDGESTFESIVDISIEMNYQISQLGRGLKYSSDPTLVIKNPTTLQDSQLVKGIGALTLDEKGDAYLLEMKSAATDAVINYFNLLRQMALEAVRGNRANPDKLGGLHSGKALQMLNSALISLVEELRLSYGQNGLLRIYTMMLAIMELTDVDTGDCPPKQDFDCAGHLILSWPDWYAPTPQDTLQKAQAIQTLRGSGTISRKTGIKAVANEFDINDIEEEIKNVEKEQTDAHNEQMQLKTGGPGTGKVDPNQN